MRIILLILLICSGCKKAPLTVQTEYWGRHDLASYVIDTPDPKKNSQEFGQRLRIEWSIPKEQFVKAPYTLDLTVRLKNGQEYKESNPLEHASGEFIYPIFGVDFYQKGGLLSYEVLIQSEGKVIAERHHKFWVEKITVTDEP
jgi:hypothetical protein